MAMLALTLVSPALLIGPAGHHAPKAHPAGGFVKPRATTPLAAATAATLTSGVEVLYDSKCMVCLTNKALLNWFDRGRERLQFVDIRSPDYSPQLHGGVLYEDAMLHFHVIAQGVVAEGSEAVFAAYQAVGLGWFINILRLPIVRFFVNAMYGFVSKHRHTISRFLPGGRALADVVTSAHDLDKAAQGEGCDDEEECVLPYDDDDEDEE